MAIFHSYGVNLHFPMVFPIVSPGVFPFSYGFSELPEPWDRQRCQRFQKASFLRAAAGSQGLKTGAREGTKRSATQWLPSV